MSRYENIWKVFALRGAFAFIFGSIALLNPRATLEALLLMFAVYVIVDSMGAYAGACGLLDRPEMRRSFIVDALIGAGVGVIVLLLAAGAALVMLFLVGIWAFVTGLMSLWTAFDMAKEGVKDWLLILKCTALTVFGLWIVLFPVASVTAIVWYAGVFAVFYGVLQIMMAFRYHRPGHRAVHAK